MSDSDEDACRSRRRSQLLCSACPVGLQYQVYRHGSGSAACPIGQLGRFNGLARLALQDAALIEEGIRLYLQVSAGRENGSPYIAQTACLDRHRTRIRTNLPSARLSREAASSETP
nr:hypothetical protein [Asaia platycodi]